MNVKLRRVHSIVRWKTRKGASESMNQTTTGAGVILDHHGQPAYVLLEYELYLAHQVEIDTWRADLAESSTKRQELTVLIAQAKRIRRQIARDPSQLTSHADLMRLLDEKQENDVAA